MEMRIFLLLVTVTAVVSSLSVHSAEGRATADLSSALDSNTESNEIPVDELSSSSLASAAAVAPLPVKKSLDTGSLSSSGTGVGRESSALAKDHVSTLEDNALPSASSSATDVDSLQSVNSINNNNETTLDVKSDGLPACPWFTCANGRCLISTWRCDQQDDCGDNSDELGCDNVTCQKEDMFRCTSGMCISNSWLCDSYKDCPNGDDEDHC